MRDCRYYLNDNTLFKNADCFSMALVGLLGFSYIVSWSAGACWRDIFGQFYSYSLCAITMFVLMGSFAFIAGIGERLYKAAYALVGDMHGGLGIATVLGCAGFAAICGSTSATAATMGRIVLPEMKKYRYEVTLATGTVASAGTLGILIPPSTIFIVYGFLTEQSIGKLFVSGIFPGLILALIFSVTIYLICKINPQLGPRVEPLVWREKIKSSFQALERYCSSSCYRRAVPGVVQSSEAVVLGGRRSGYRPVKAPDQ